MRASRFLTSTNRRDETKLGQIKELRVSRTSKVLAERNQAVVSVGTWVEGGQDFLEHPSELALLTEELQTEKRRRNEESLRRFQDEVRLRVTQRANVQKRQQPHMHPKVTPPDRTIPHFRVWNHQVSVREEQTPAETASHQRSCSPESSEALRQARLRLAACRVIQPEETSSDLPGGRWNVSPTRRRDSPHMLRLEGGVLEEEEQEERDVPLFVGQHDCPLVQQKMVRQTCWDPDESHPDPGSKSSLRVPQVLWPLTDREKLKKQHQSQFLIHRRLAMSTEREQVKENKQLRKHLRRTASIKAEKERVRLEEERRLERVQQLAEVKQKLEERELLIQERLKLEEERDVQLHMSKTKEKEKDTGRFVEALRAHMKERLSQLKLEPPPLCCCASSFWESHPNTCANNCIFHNNPKAYAKALHSTMMGLDLQ